jgi:ribosomal protein L7/L12
MANLEKLVEELSGLTILEAAELKTMLEENGALQRLPAAA